MRHADPAGGGAVGAGAALHFPYRFSGAWMPLMRMLGVQKHDGVSLSGSELVATFGPYTVRTPTSNIASAEVDGPHRWYTAVGLRLSFQDDGITFGTNHRRGVTIRFHDKVDKVIVRPGHSSLWVSVADPDGLVEAIRRVCGGLNGDPARRGTPHD